jgi:hypothetical protein
MCLNSISWDSVCQISHDCVEVLSFYVLLFGVVYLKVTESVVWSGDPDNRWPILDLRTGLQIFFKSSSFNYKVVQIWPGLFFFFLNHICQTLTCTCQSSTCSPLEPTHFFPTFWKHPDALLKKGLWFLYIFIIKLQLGFSPVGVVQKGHYYS